MNLDAAYTVLYSVALLIFAALLAVVLLRAIRGPQITDRLVAINMIGTLVIAIFALLCVLLKESYLTDVALIYALVSFVSVLVFSSIYIRKKKGED